MADLPVVGRFQGKDKEFKQFKKVKQVKAVKNYF